MNFCFRILLLASFTSLIAAMQPRDVTFHAEPHEQAVAGSLEPFIMGIQPPYLVLPKQGNNGRVLIEGGTAHFIFSFASNAATTGTFQYRLLNDQGITALATVTIIRKAHPQNFSKSNSGI